MPEITETIRTPKQYRPAAAEAAREGADLLDAAEPGWQYRINRDRLDMQDCTHCIAGQMTTLGFAYVVNFLGAPPRVGRDDSARMEWLARHGFTLPADILDGIPWERHRPYWEVLGGAWLGEVDRRLAADVTEAIR
jgi:hypothetical protein